MSTLPLILTACDPLVSLQGSFWPPWIIAMLMAFPMTTLMHVALTRLGLKGRLGPVLIIYPALWTLMTCMAWLIAFDW